MTLHRRKKPARPVGEQDQPFISIIIPAHNEEEFLPGTLEALARQSYARFETIVVANGCTDRTAEVVRGKCTQFFDLQERGLGPARNLGAAKAKGNLLLFLDADTILAPDALGKIARKFSRRYAMGTVRGVPDSKKLSYKLIYLVKNGIHATHLHHGSSGVILCWKDFFEAVGGFNNELYLRENSDLMKKLRRYGKYKYISTAPAVTSMRRYEEKGTIEMALLWLRVWYLSNFSDIRNKTYDGFCAEGPKIKRAPQNLKEWWRERRAQLRATKSPISFWS
jgi:glycosyltransferase involved in cell wall biosynthesis